MLCGCFFHTPILSALEGRDSLIPLACPQNTQFLAPPWSLTDWPEGQEHRRASPTVFLLTGCSLLSKAQKATGGWGGAVCQTLSQPPQGLGVVLSLLSELSQVISFSGSQLPYLPNKEPRPAL